MVNGKKTKKAMDLSQSNLVDTLLSKGKKTKISSQKYQAPQKPKKSVSFSTPNKYSSSQNKNTSIPKYSGNTQIISNFHKAISSTNSDEVILKMLDLKEKDIVIFYKNLEKLIGKDMSSKIKTEMAGQLINKTSSNVSTCPFCLRNKSNCVILLCGHLLCSECGKNINRCKFPCPKCKKPIKYIQYIADI